MHIVVLVTGINPQLFEDNPLVIFKQQDAHYIEALKRTNKTVINLSKFISHYESYARYRIVAIKVTFLDKNGMVLPYHMRPNWNPKPTTVIIGFPNEFIDVNTNGNNYTFFAKQDYECKSSYLRRTDIIGKTA